MPLGNGDIGLNVWVEENGDLLFYLSKTDAWDEKAQLLKLGRIRVSLSPNPFVTGAVFRQELDLAAGAVRIISTHRSPFTLLLWVDVNRPVVRVEIEADRPVEVRVALDHWRTDETIVKDAGGDVIWCHRNTSSCWAATLEHQDMADWIPQGRDPLHNRTFGALLRGEGLVREGDAALRTATPCTRLAFALHPLTAQPETLAAWTEAVSALAARNDAVSDFAAHTAWWKAFWERSYIRVTGTPEAEAVSRGYELQRFINACGGRGAFPIKFNGSIFTVDAREGTRDGYGDENHDADYRRWGGGYWFQNTRLTYWPMIASGDFDLMEPWFRLYLDALPFARARAKASFGLDNAAMFPETMHFWGAFLNENYGFNRGNLPSGLTENLYIRRYWQGMLELLAVLLDAYAVSGEERLLREKLLVLAPPFLRFFRDYYARRDDAGKLRMEPAQSLETWWEAVNPLPDIAGLHWVLDGLLALPADACSVDLRTEWQDLRAILPPVPTRTCAGGKTVILPALQYDGCNNCENPELYAIFPYRLYGVGKPDLETGRRTFAARQFKSGGGWQQDAIHAALLGLTAEAKAAVVSNFSTHHKGSRFPAFWGPNYDWIPDQDHGAVACIALQRMLMQCDPPLPAGSGEASGGKIRLLPAWPKEWNVDFRLHAPGRTVVEGRVEQGVLRDFRITPVVRRRDVVVNDYNAPVSWRVSGVFARPAGGVGEAVVPVMAEKRSFLVDATPSSRDRARECGGSAASTEPESWRTVTPDADGFVNLRDGCGGKDGLVYLANRFVAPFAGRWELAIGHDGGIRLFVDGFAVLAAPETRNPARPGRSVLTLDLAQGLHEVVIAFDLAGGNGWGIFAEWRVPEGEQADAVQRLLPRMATEI